VKTLILDCDGTIFNSNPLKTEAFRQTTAPFGKVPSQALVNYHLQNGGMTRYAKFEHFLRNIIKSQEPIEPLVASYASYVRASLLSAPCAPLRQLKNLLPNTTWIVVSGGDPNEISEALDHKGLLNLFDDILGAPEPKHNILRKLNVQHPALYIGDSRLDHQAAQSANIGFVFVYAWSDFAGWNDYCSIHNIPTLAGLYNLLDPQNLKIAMEAAI